MKQEGLLERTIQRYIPEDGILSERTSYMGGPTF
jgi:hypothetical protein